MPPLPLRALGLAAGLALFACGQENPRASDAGCVFEAGVTQRASGCGDGALEPEDTGGSARHSPAPRLVKRAELAPSSASKTLHEAACASPSTPAPALEPGRFVDVSGPAGLPAELSLWLCNSNVVECDARSMLGGGAVGDFDDDGLPDLYLARGQFKDMLLLNCGGYFADVTDRVGISKADQPTSGAVFGDVDSDGDLDLFVTSLGSEARRHYLYIQAGGTFREEGVNRGVSMLDTGPLYGTGAAFGDVDRDGYLDLYVAEWRDDNLFPLAPPEGNHARLLMNRGAAAPGTFEDATERAGLVLGGTTSNGILTADGVFGFTPIFADFDEDGLLDLALSADYGSSRLFWNQGDGTFVDGTEDSKVGTDQAGMGADVGDFDADGRLDWLVTSIYDPRYGWTGNRLYRNLGQRQFQDVSKELGVRDGGWAWGVAFADFDLDGVLELFSVSGFRARGLSFGPQDRGSVRLYRQKTGPDAAYEEVSAALMPALGGEGRGAALLDFDGDGDQDVFIALHQGAARLWRNDLVEAPGQFVRIVPVGKRELRATGARLTLTAGTQRAVRELHTGSGYLGQSEAAMLMGVPPGVSSVRAELRWPSGEVSEFEAEVGHTWLVYEP